MDEESSGGLYAVGFAFIGTALGMAVYLLAARRRFDFLGFAIPGALASIGLGFVGVAASRQYGSRVDEAEAAVRDQLADLDPFARVKILKDLAEEQVPTWARRSAPQE